MNKDLKEDKVWKKRYLKGMKKKCDMPLAYDKKLEKCKREGKYASRLIFKAEIQEYFTPNREYPFGWLALYDDMSEKDLVCFFRKYKKCRIDRLKKVGVKTRKHYTEKTMRDYKWKKMAGRYHGTPDYKVIAKQWAKKNKGETLALYLSYAWNNPNAIVGDFRNEIETAKRNKMTKDSFLKLHRASQKSYDRFAKEIKQYVDFHLPKSIRSAINRIKK